MNVAKWSVALLVLMTAVAGCNGFFTDDDDDTITGAPLFAANEGGNSIAAFSVNGSTGALTAVTGSPFSASRPNVLGSNSNGNFLYAASLNNGILGWVVGTDNSLGTMSGSPFGSGAFVAVAVDPAARYVYGAANGAPDLSLFLVNSSTGVLTEDLVNLPDPTHGNPIRLIVDPTGKFVFVAVGANGVDRYTIGVNGVLTGPGAAAYDAAGAASAVAASPNGNFLYTADGTSAVGAYTINSTTGDLTLIGAGTTPAGTQPVGLTVNPAGTFLYVANQGSNNVSAYSINATTGALTEITGSPFTVGTGPVSVSVEPGGRFLYVGNRTAGTVSIMSINSTSGALTAAGTVPSGTNTNSVLATR